ncbi:putative metal-binding motif-containing protein [Vulgatibacter incomptus]|nr:putative metal-binding motif-containing protein [Vulgatibacter incomptus]
MEPEIVRTPVDADSFALAAESGRSIAFELPITLPRTEGATFDLDVQATALTLAGAPAHFAAATAEVDATAPDSLAAVRFVLSLSPDFDYDGDGYSDVVDCDPDDPTIHPGADDPCDGVDRSCNPGVCYLPLPAGKTGVRDITCDATTCLVAVGGKDGGKGAILRFDATLAAPEPRSAFETDDPRGLAILSSNSTTLFYEASTRTISSVGADDSAGRQFLVGAGLRGVISTSPFETMAFASFASAPRLLSFAPTALAGAPGDLECDAGAEACTFIRLENLSDGESTLGNTATPSRIVTRHTDSNTDGIVYITFREDNRLGIATVDAGTRQLVPGASGLLHALATERPRALHLSSNAKVLYVAGGIESNGEAAAISTGRLPSSHTSTPFDLPAGTCPSALKVIGSKLFVADDCQGRVWELALGADGLPAAGFAPVEHALPGCTKPSMLASVPASGQASAALLVGCADADRIVVLGRD